MVSHSSTVIILAALLWALQCGARRSVPITCAYHPSDRVIVAEQLTQTFMDQGASVKCEVTRLKDDTVVLPACTSIYFLNNVSDENGNWTIKAELNYAGCSLSTGRDCYNQTKCRANLTALTTEPRWYCCCDHDQCNTINNTILLSPIPDEGNDLTWRLSHDDSSGTIIIVGIVIGVAFLVILIVFSYYMYRRKKQKEEIMKQKVSQYNYEMRMYNDNPEPPVVNYDDLKLDLCLHKGRFGEVYKAKLNDEDVCVKYFHVQQRTLFYNEKDIYGDLDPSNSNIVRCIASDERILMDNSVQYIVIMEYVDLGSLSNYLKNNLLTWSDLCSIGESISGGLGYLHSELRNPDGTIKHAIVHRDLNSRNILVRPNMTCAIADMGFSMKIRGSKVIKNGTEEHAEDGSLRDVGTVRYMAPEILDCAVNLRDCESSLKQIDVYALSLVLWELLTRCPELVIEKPKDVEVSRFLLPFERELGAHPSFEAMRIHVAKNHRRPEFPFNLRANKAARSLRETIEECWDTDAEARLTAMGVESRFKNMIDMMDDKGLHELSLNEHGEKKRYSSSNDIIPRSVEEIIPLLAQRTPCDEMSTVTMMTPLTPGSHGGHSYKPDLTFEMDDRRRSQGRNVVGDFNALQINGELPVHDHTLLPIEEARTRQKLENERQKRLYDMAQRSTDSNTSHDTNTTLSCPRVPLDVSSGDAPENPAVTKIKENNLNARRHNSQHNLNESSTSSNGGVGNIITIQSRQGRPKSLNLNIKPDEQT